MYFFLLLSSSTFDFFPLFRYVILPTPMLILVVLCKLHSCSASERFRQHKKKNTFTNNGNTIGHLLLPLKIKRIISFEYNNNFIFVLILTLERK
jgi:hypothetical protein